jgi:hypothetical protein
MKFTVEVDDFWIEEEELSGALVRQIKEQIVNQIQKTVDQKIDAQITNKVTKEVNDYINAAIQKKLSELIETGTIVKEGKVISIQDYVNNLFVSNQGWNSPRDQILKLAEKFGIELKTRYDAIFANRIVVKLNEQGMLKDEVVKLLIDSK